MQCYNFNCKEECNELKKQYCIFKVTKQQKELVARINKNNCKTCGMKMAECRFNYISSKLCTSCGTIWRDREVVSTCLVNSRRVG